MYSCALCVSAHHIALILCTTSVAQGNLDCVPKKLCLFISSLLRNVSRHAQCTQDKHHVPIRGWNSKIVSKRSRSPRIPSKAGSTCNETRSQRRTSRKLGAVSTNRNTWWRWSPQWLLVNRRWLHLSSSHWTSSSPLRAERRIVPNSTEMCWRDQDYVHKAGCIAGKTFQRLLERRYGSKFIRFMDKIHEVHAIEWETSSRICVVWGATCEDPSNHQTWLSVAWDLDWHVKKQLKKRKSKNGPMEKLMIDSARKMRGIYFYCSGRWRENRDH